MKWYWKLLIVLVVVLLALGWVRYFWVFGEGAKAGQLNYVVHKGYLFKTYEGKPLAIPAAAAGPKAEYLAWHRNHHRFKA